MNDLQVNLSEFAIKGPNTKRNQHKVDLQSASNNFSMDEDNHIRQEIKAACKHYEAVGKQMLVLVAEKGHCHWYGSPLATQFIKQQYQLIFEFFTFCTDKQKTESDINKTKTDEDASAEITDVQNITKTVNGLISENITIKFEIDPPHNQNHHTDDFGDDDNNDDDDNVDDDEKDDDLKDTSYQDETETGDKSEKSEKNSDDSKYIDKAVNDYLSGKTDGQFSCGKCGAKFSHEGHLKTHEIKRLNCDERNFKQKYVINDILDEEVTFFDKKSMENVTTTFRQILDEQKNKDKLPICPICKKIYFTCCQLTRHFSRHVKAAIYECNICSHRTKQPASLVNHTKMHFEAPYDCYLCKKMFKTLEEQKIHIDANCSITATRTLTESLMGEVYKEELLRCDQCEYRAPHPIMLTAHKTSHSGPLLCICTECGKQLSCMTSLFRHVLCVHIGSRKHRCSICKDKTFKDKASLKRHYKTHSEKSFICKECGKGFREEGYLRVHMKTHSNIRPYMCDYCGAKFKRKIFLDCHRRLHTGETPFCCDVEGCGKAFRSKTSLVQHTRTHTDHRFICDMCGTKFKHPNALFYHRKKHSDECRWACAYCPEKFPTVWRYKRHLVNYHPEKKDEIEQNTKIKLHQCKLCQKLYHDPEDLRRHMNNHEGIKPYKCTVCEKAFSDKSNLSTHMYTHTGGKKYSCHVCHKRFVQEKNLNLHIEKIHPNVSQEPYLADQQHMLGLENNGSMLVTVEALQILE